jgi:hypothetical protein
MEFSIPSDIVTKRISEEYKTFVESIDCQMSPLKTIIGLGGTENYNMVMRLIESYNHKEGIFSSAVAEIVLSITDKTFNYNRCLHDESLFWSFLKTSECFIHAPWYRRDYIVARLLGKRVKIPDLL